MKRLGRLPIIDDWEVERFIIAISKVSLVKEGLILKQQYLSFVEFRGLINGLGVRED